MHLAALELEDPLAAAELGQRLGGERHVAGDERQRGGPLEQGLQRLGAGLVGRALGQRVLDDPEVGAGVVQRGAELHGLLYRETPVVHGEDRIGLLYLLGHAVDDRCLLLLLHLVSKSKEPAPRN